MPAGVREFISFRFLRKAEAFTMTEGQYFTSEGECKVIGDTVTVTVDRPLGSYHPEHPGLYYPINYGYIKGTMASDGEEEDAYILGIRKPVKEYTGKVIAVIHRKDDIEHKWVVAPDGSAFTAEEIRTAVHFQEQYFQSVISFE